MPEINPQLKAYLETEIAENASSLVEELNDETVTEDDIRQAKLIEEIKFVNTAAGDDRILQVQAHGELSNRQKVLFIFQLGTTHAVQIQRIESTWYETLLGFVKCY